MKLKIASIVGARPQFIKLAPLDRAIRSQNEVNPSTETEHLIIHSGQHYDNDMNKAFFDDLGIPEPDYNLEVGSGTQGWQTGEMIKRTEEVLLKEKPDLVLVYGDTNTTLAGSLSAAKLTPLVAHVESGLRSHNKIMSEEINRILTDHCSDILFCPTENAVRNLQKESFIHIINEGKLINSSPQRVSIEAHQLPAVVNTGDIMYETFLMSLERAVKKSLILKKLGLKPKEYYLATIHRAENTDNKNRLKKIIEILTEISKEKPVIFPIHPRTKKNLGCNSIFSLSSNKLYIINPISYFDMLVLEKNANKILTDSGGVQKEASWLGVLCVTLREETEWMETVDAGWNVLAGIEINRIIQALQRKQPEKSIAYLFGDGQTSKHIAYLCERLLVDFKIK